MKKFEIFLLVGISAFLSGCISRYDIIASGSDRDKNGIEIFLHPEKIGRQLSPAEMLLNPGLKAGIARAETENKKSSDQLRDEMLLNPLSWAFFYVSKNPVNQNLKDDISQEGLKIIREETDIIKEYLIANKYPQLENFSGEALKLRANALDMFLLQIKQINFATYRFGSVKKRDEDLSIKSNIANGYTTSSVDSLWNIMKKLSIKHEYVPRSGWMIDGVEPHPSKTYIANIKEFEFSPGDGAGFAHHCYVTGFSHDYGMHFTNGTRYKDARRRFYSCMSSFSTTAFIKYDYPATFEVGAYTYNGETVGYVHEGEAIWNMAQLPFLYDKSLNGFLFQRPYIGFSKYDGLKEFAARQASFDSSMYFIFTDVDFENPNKNSLYVYHDRVLRVFPLNSIYRTPKNISNLDIAQAKSETSSCFLSKSEMESYRNLKLPKDWRIVTDNQQNFSRKCDFGAIWAQSKRLSQFGSSIRDTSSMDYKDAAKFNLYKGKRYGANNSIIWFRFVPPMDKKKEPSLK